MTPEDFAARCSDIVTTMHGHEAHRALDFLTNDVLRELGYGEGIAIFEAEVAHWHAASDPYPYPQICPDCHRDSVSRPEGQDGEAGLVRSTAERRLKAASPTPKFLNRSNPNEPG